MKHTKKEKSDNKLIKRKPWLIAGSLVVIVLLAFLFRGWFRMTVIPKTIHAVYGNSAEEVLKAEAAKLQDPISLLGFVSEEPNFGGCSTAFAKRISTQVICSYQIPEWREIAQDPQAKADLAANADKLQSLLKENGWQGEYSEDGTYTSLKKLISSINAGIDYQPDATYQKQIGNVHCYLQSNTAFASPAPPAFATRMFCSRTFNVLGEPSYGP